MAIPLSSKPNVIPPGGNYPYGNIKDNPGDGTGTPVNSLVYADFHQFFARLIDQSGITPNGLPDNAANGFQYYEALRNVIDNFIIALIDSAPGALNTLNELAQALGDDPNFATTVINTLTSLQNSKANIAQPAFVDIPLMNGAANPNGVNGHAPSVMKDTIGFVHFEGSIQINLDGVGSTIISEVGSGYRPLWPRYYWFNHINKGAYIIVFPNGLVSASSPNAGFHEFDLENIVPYLARQ